MRGHCIMHLLAALAPGALSMDNGMSDCTCIDPWSHIAATEYVYACRCSTQHHNTTTTQLCGKSFVGVRMRTDVVNSSPLSHRHTIHIRYFVIQ